MDGKTHHLSKPVMIGRITEDGRILPVSVTEGLVPPDPWSPWLAALGFPPAGCALAAPSAWRVRLFIKLMRISNAAHNRVL